MLALSGNERRAEELRDRAVATYRALGVSAECPAPPRATGRNLLRREGDVWAVGFERRVVRLRDTKGLRYIARLVRHAGQELHVIDLAGGADVREADATPAPDEQARAAYRGRLTALRDQLEEAERCNDVGRRPVSARDGGDRGRAGRRLRPRGARAPAAPSASGRP
jgi:hypothetical protein